MNAGLAAGGSERRFEAKGQDEFVALVEEHKKILFKIAAAYCRDAVDREDLIQEIVVQLWRSFDRYDDRLRFSTWMYRIALNVAISSYRREMHRTKRTIPAAESLLESIPAAPGDAGRDDQIRELQDFIAQLDDLNRALMILYLEDRPHEEIASILGISATNVATKIGRVKQKLRSHALVHGSL
jgi:RNA polymerase sigma factor (sigma-70 family)